MGVDLLSVVGCERRTEDPPVVLEHGRVAVVTESFQQLRAALDVGEQERDGARRQVRHAARIPPWFLVVLPVLPLRRSSNS